MWAKNLNEEFKGETQRVYKYMKKYVNWQSENFQSKTKMIHLCLSCCPNLESWKSQILKAVVRRTPHGPAGGEVDTAAAIVEGRLSDVHPATTHSTPENTNQKNSHTGL